MIDTTVHKCEHAQARSKQIRKKKIQHQEYTSRIRYSLHMSTIQTDTHTHTERFNNNNTRNNWSYDMRGQHIYFHFH